MRQLRRARLASIASAIRRPDVTLVHAQNARKTTSTAIQTQLLPVMAAKIATAAPKTQVNQMQRRYVDPDMVRRQPRSRSARLDQPRHADPSVSAVNATPMSMYPTPTADTMPNTVMTAQATAHTKYARGDRW